ncbi:unnamed protein product [Chrysoparadoxa australica]
MLLVLLAVLLLSPVLSLRLDHLVSGCCVSVLQEILEGVESERAVSRGLRQRKELVEEQRGQIAQVALSAAVSLHRLRFLHPSYGADATNPDAASLLALHALEKGDKELALCFKAEPDLGELETALARAEWPADATQRLSLQCSLPLWLARELIKGYGLASATDLGKALMQKGPVCARANQLKTSREQLQDDLWKEHQIKMNLAPVELAARGLVFDEGRPDGGIWSLLPYTRGEFEVQDLGSQYIIDSCCAQPGDKVLDLCAGNGGKSLGLAAAVGATGRVDCFDINEARLVQLHMRSKRAGADGIIRVLKESPSGSEHRYDVVLVDAPCSSTGVLRRRVNLREALQLPDAEREALVELPLLQKQLLRQAADMVRPGGRLVYATCSMLLQENQEISAWFQEEGANDFYPWPFASEVPSAAHTKQLLPSSGHVLFALALAIPTLNDHYLYLGLKENI